MIGQGYPLTVRDSADRWWYVIAWEAVGDHLAREAARLLPVVVPVGESFDRNALPRVLVDVVSFDADPDALAGE
jgi:hypothetical protein